MRIEPRLAAHMQVSTFVRRAHNEGDFAAVLRKGDPISGAILLIRVIRGKNPIIYERFPSLDGMYSWQNLPLKDSPTATEVDAYLEKRIQRDPDLWVIELDTADDERFTRLIS
jgi:hypothetical protein